jgi:formylglycine-generating enzyme required for sulfatase activity
MLASAATSTGFRDEPVYWLLGALAFQMVLEDNFFGINEGEFSGFIRRVWDCQKANSPFGDYHTFENWLELLGQTNEFLNHCFLEGHGMKQVFWRNRTLQEFFAGLWLARFASAKDCDEIADRVYLAHEPKTQDYYWVWRFAAEMPAPCRAVESWIAAMQPLYKPGDGTAAGTRRSTEMIYRSLRTVEYAVRTGEPHAKPLRKAYVEQLLDPYQDEVQTAILGKTRDRGVPKHRRPSQIMTEFLTLRSAPEEFVFGFRRIPPDEDCSLEFTMGSPPDQENRHDDEGPWEVAIEHPFDLACTPTTNEQYELFDPSHRERGWGDWDFEGKYAAFLRGDDYKQGYRDVPRCAKDRLCPVVNISWYDAWAFCLWLGDPFGLPTEKQWEYACRAGRQTRYCFGNDEERLGEYAWMSSNSSRTHPIGKKRPNAWGVYDVHGNVREWCADWWRDNGASSVDHPHASGADRVVRGSSYMDEQYAARCAIRDRLPADFPSLDSGFRVARALYGDLNPYFRSLRKHDELRGS